MAPTRVSVDELKDMDEKLRMIKQRKNRRAVVTGLAASAVVLATLGPVGVVVAGVGTGYVVRRLHKRRERKYKAKIQAHAEALAKQQDDCQSSSVDDEEGDFEAFSLNIEQDESSVISSLSESGDASLASAWSDHDDQSSHVDRVVVGRSLPPLEERGDLKSVSTVRSFSLFGDQEETFSRSVWSAPLFEGYAIGYNPTRSASLLRGAIPDDDEEISQPESVRTTKT